MMSSPGCSPHSPLSAMNKKVESLICDGIGVLIISSTIVAAVALHGTGHRTVIPTGVQRIDVVEYRGTKLKWP